MANLTATAPGKGADITHGAARLQEMPMGTNWAVMPYHGKTSAVASALKEALGVPWPGAGTFTEAGETRLAWSGCGQAMLMGATPPDGLSDLAGLSDQSDGWTHLALSGPTSTQVLSRLVAVDLSLAACPVGSSLRTSLGHMQAMVLRTGTDRFELLAFRSMAGTMVHELDRAMRMVAARAARDAG